MPAGAVRADSHDLHGSAPDACEVALLIIDVINDLEFEHGNLLFRQAIPMAAKLSALKKRLKKAGVPVIYVNDNFGRWQSNYQHLVEHCLRDEVLGREVVLQLRPDEDDYFVLKPKHSGFFSTTLETLLRYLGSSRLILTGMSTNICVLFTANDAYMRDFELVVPSDCVAANSSKESEWALREMSRTLKADTRPSSLLRTKSLMRKPAKAKQRKK